MTVLKEAIREINGQFGTINFNIGLGAIERAIADGHDRRLLRWRVSGAQGLAMHIVNISISTNPSPPIACVESGASFECGAFCGIPFAIDRSLPDDVVLLEVLEPSPIMRIFNLPTMTGHLDK
jgi:hypothetical protein